jgi:hypothetical protein
MIGMSGSDSESLGSAAKNVPFVPVPDDRGRERLV